MAALENQTQFDTARIPVDSVVLYRTPGMDDFELCHVLNVCSEALDILFTHSLPLHTSVTIVVEDESSPDQFYQLVGEVRHREPLGDEWLHSISAAPGRQKWSSTFLYDVMCSNADQSEELAEGYRSAYDDHPGQLRLNTVAG
ncbi:hypothetical protein N9H39_02820 [Gammaproteobacteria bacterium]|nr:hypothetical protein [Gammaproteobacteria bacterium]